MKINIFHYHLKPGGVTRIIQSQVEGLRKTDPRREVTIYAGDCPDPETYEKLGAKVRIIEELDYLERRDYSFEEIHRRSSMLTKHLQEVLDRKSILHFHNLNLGKNPVVTIAFNRLADMGYRIFNHVHDLAEDRPSNMEFLRQLIETYGLNTQQVLYPDNPNFLFGALNSRDVMRIQESGIPGERIFFLPNPVKMNSVPDISGEKARNDIVNTLGLDQGKKIITYPVRVIRRKNIGEYILLAALFHEEAEFLVTLPPQNPVEVTPYEEWKDFCIKEGVPLHFEAGNQVDFDRLLAATDACITTSSMEGFGMVFMEPWLMGTPVIGRNLDYVTRDLVDAGMEFSLLYDVLCVPSYEKDFKDLDPAIQKEVIRDTWNDNGRMKEKIFSLNHWMESLFELPGVDVIRRNAMIISEEFSLDKYTKRLYEAYHKYTD